MEAGEGHGGSRQTYHPMMPMPRDPVDRRSLKRRVAIWLVCKVIGHKHFVDPHECTRCEKEWV